MTLSSRSTMRRHLATLALGLGLACTPERAPSSPPPAAAAPAPAAPMAAAPQVDAGAAHCSAAGLPGEPPASAAPLPPAVQETRRRIVAAAVRCDYAALSALAREGTVGFAFTPGGKQDPGAVWRALEEQRHEPILRRMVQVLGAPFVEQQGGYAWPSAHREAGPTAEDLKALEGAYTPAQLASFRQMGSYLGLRIALSPSGEWLFATSGG